MFELDEEAQINIYYQETAHNWKRIFSQIQLLKVLQQDCVDLIVSECVGFGDECNNAAGTALDKVLEPQTVFEILHDVSMFISLGSLS